MRGGRKIAADAATSFNELGLLSLVTGAEAPA